MEQSTPPSSPSELTSTSELTLTHELTVTHELISTHGIEYLLDKNAKLKDRLIQEAERRKRMEELLRQAARRIDALERCLSLSAVLVGLAAVRSSKLEYSVYVRRRLANRRRAKEERKKAEQRARDLFVPPWHFQKVQENSRRSRRLSMGPLALIGIIVLCLIIQRHLAEIKRVLCDYHVIYIPQVYDQLN